MPGTEEAETGRGPGKLRCLVFLLSNTLPHLSFRLTMSFQGQNWISSSFDNGRENFRRKLLTIDSQLGEKEVEQLKFLCQDFISHKKLERSSSALDVFDHLMAKELLSDQDPFLLAELLYTMQQPLLLKHLNYTKEQVKSLLPTLRKVSLFR